MTETPATGSPGFQRVENADDSLTLLVLTDLTVDTSARLLDQIRRELSLANPFPPLIHLDLSAVSRTDDYGVLLINEIKSLAAKHQSRATLSTASTSVQNALSLYQDTIVEDKNQSVSTAFSPGLSPSAMIADLGAATRAKMHQADSSISFIGTLFFALGKALVRPRRIRYGDMVDFIKSSGVDAIPIVTLVGLIIGLILAFVASVQLEQFGGQIFIPAMITFAMVSEVGPMMTAILIAGRTGSAYAAEIGTMNISEEIAALTSMGFNPVLFLVIPRLSALLVALPILTVLSVFAAIGGGLLVCVTMLQLMPGPYLQGVSDALFIDDIIWGLAKSAVFAILIAFVGCLRGIQVKGGAAAVGSAATSAVVSSIFLIILSDSIFAIIRIYWG